MCEYALELENDVVELDGHYQRDQELADAIEPVVTGAGVESGWYYRAQCGRDAGAQCVRG